MSWRTALVLAVGIVSTSARAETPDPRLAKLTYDGTGAAEKAPEIGEVSFTFSVECRTSAEDVRQAIEAVSGGVWKSIATKVPAASTNELRQANWGNIGGITENNGSEVESIPPEKVGGVTVKGTAKRIETCTGKEVDLRAKVASTYSGSQTIGVRSEDLDWVESLARTVKALPQDKAKNTVKITAVSTSYTVTESAKRSLLGETLTKARAEALGANSKFASDKKTLKFASAHYLGHRLSSPPYIHPEVGSAVSRGTAPKVTLDLPFVYTIYSEGKDLINTTNSKLAGISSDYEITGKAVANADYAVISASVVARCQPSSDAALAATEPYSTKLHDDLKKFHGERAATETDRIVNNEPGKPTVDYPYEPVEWNTAEPKSPVTKYLNKCTNEIVDAPVSHNASDLPGYWTVTRNFGLRSSDFARLLTHTDDLQKAHNTATTRADETRIVVSDATAAVKDATKQKLAIAARENATAFVLNAHGPLADDARAHGFTSAHLVNIRVGSPRPAVMQESMSKGMGLAAMKMAAPMAPSQELAIEVVHKEGSERPQFRMVRSYAFDVQVITENYIPHLNVEKAAPKDAKPGEQHLP